MDNLLILGVLLAGLAYLISRNKTKNDEEIVTLKTKKQTLEQEETHINETISKLENDLTGTRPVDLTPAEVEAYWNKDK